MHACVLDLDRAIAVIRSFSVFTLAIYCIKLGLLAPHLSAASRGLLACTSLVASCPSRCRSSIAAQRSTATRFLFSACLHCMHVLSAAWPFRLPLACIIMTQRHARSMRQLQLRSRFLQQHYSTFNLHLYSEDSGLCSGAMASEVVLLFSLS